MRGYLVLAALLGGGTLLVVGLCWNVPGTSSAVYSFGVTQFLARRDFDNPVRVQGTLVPGSLCKVEADCGYRFSLVDTEQGKSRPPAPGDMLSVAYDGCLLPDTLRDVPGLRVEVSVTGERCRTCHQLEASSLIAKVRGRYEMTSDGHHVKPAETPRCQPRM